MPGHPGRGNLPDKTACGRRMERSTGQQLKMVPFGDQQPFLLQLGKLHRHGGTLHAEKIRQLLTVKGNVKGEGGLPDGFGRQVGQQLFPGGALADMCDLIVKKQYFVCQNVLCYQKKLYAGREYGDHDGMQSRRCNRRFL